MADEPAPAPTASDDLDRRSLALGLGAVVAAVAALRLLPLLVHDWALGDGGLFYAMVGDLIESGFALPDTVSYQGGIVLFAYPPLGFYVTAALEQAIGVERIELFRWLPALASVAAVPAMYLLAAEIGPSRRHALVAAAFFGALIGLTTFLSSGGGLTRTPGLMLALLASWQGLRMFRTRRARDVVLTAVVSGLAVLTHPEAGPFLAITLGVALLTRWRTRDAFVRLALAAAGALLLVSPWLIVVGSRHGVGAFLDAADATERDLFESAIAYLFLFLLTAPVVGLLDLLGQVQQLVARRPQLLLWRISVFLIDMRFSPISGAAPASMLAAHGLLDVLTPAAWNLAGRGRGGNLDEQRRIRWRRALVVVAVTLAFVPTSFGTLTAMGPRGAISEDQREAMAWVRANTSAATITASLATDAWGSDDVSEWFPALSTRRSATTTQGTEWDKELGAPMRAAEAELRTCQSEASDQAACVAAWVERHLDGEQAVLYLDRPALAAALMDDYGYRELWAADENVLLQPA